MRSADYRRLVEKLMDAFLTNETESAKAAIQGILSNLYSTRQQNRELEEILAGKTEDSIETDRVDDPVYKKRRCI